MSDKSLFIFIEYILESIKDINTFILKTSKEEFGENKEKLNAVIRSLEIIGGAVKNLPVSFREKYPEVPWKEIAGLRDIIIHQYFDVDLDVIWDTIKKDIPILEKQIIKIKRDLEK
ncbi:MAG: DUF86 domain-containing protein [Nanoarchaeota archaeon]|nr:DUF86 domain-containing protein [Nanoarchaeota archaeon]MBU0962950.1 DUF86 domain-containing protein [Nanoarchaeota archaeon]